MPVRDQAEEAAMRSLIQYIWGTVVRPRATFDALASERTIRWAVILACLPVLQVWGNITLPAAFGLDWLGTRPLLADPTRQHSSAKAELPYPRSPAVAAAGEEPRRRTLCPYRYATA